MTQLVQVTQGELGRPLVVEDDVGDASNLAVPGNGDDRKRQFMNERGINRDHAFHTPPEQQARIFFDPVPPVPMTRTEIKLSSTPTASTDAAHHKRVRGDPA